MSQKTLADLEWSRIQNALGDRCQTSVGIERANALFPTLSKTQIEHDLQSIDELRVMHDAGEPPPFGGIKDLRTPLTVASKGGALEAGELIDFAGHLHGLHALRRHIVSREEDGAKISSSLAKEIPDLLAFAQKLSGTFDESGELRDSASADLGHLRKTVIRLAGQLKKTINRILGSNRTKTLLQDEYYTVRDHRYVLPVRAEHRAEVNGIVHGTSQSGATLFIEPEEVVDLGNRYKIALSAVEREEHRILAELTRAVVERQELILAGIAIGATLDLLNAKAILANDLLLATPTIEPKNGKLALYEARHPHLLLQKVQVVSNEISLRKESRVLVISGPNTGGKTVSLKTVGLCALFLRAGLPIPADKRSRMPLYKRVFSDIGDEQSLERNLSTFSGRVLNTLAILQEAKEGDLVLLDEIAAGTEPAQGAAFACAILETLSQTKAHVFTTTHYELPKTLALQNSLFQNASVGFNDETLSPTYRLHLGVPGRSNALEVATRLGASPALIERSKSFLSKGGKIFEETLAALDKERQLLEDERRRMEKTRNEAEKRLENVNKRSESLKAREKALLQETHKGLLHQLQEARASVEKADRRLRERQKHEKDQVGNEAAVRKAREALTRAQNLEKRVSEKLETERQKERERLAANPEEILPGKAVYIASLSTEGIVEEPPDEKGRVRVRVGTLKTQVHQKEISLLQTKPAKTSAKKREYSVTINTRETTPSPTGDDPPPMTSDITLDLRGQRVDDALFQADSFLDQMLQRDRAYCYFIHGHGTGALKQALREFLQKSPLVSTVQAGGLKHGGDGITLARMA